MAGFVSGGSGSVDDIRQHRVPLDEERNWIRCEIYNGAAVHF